MKSQLRGKDNTNGRQSKKGRQWFGKATYKLAGKAERQKEKNQINRNKRVGKIW